MARLAQGRFAVLLPETDEVQAINYVERVRGECERRLATGAVPIRLFVGWASPAPGGDLDGAMRTAEERMYAERRRALAREAEPPAALVVPPAGTPPSSVAVSADGSAPRSVRDVLAELEEIRRGGLIGDEEYEAKRAEILSRL
ncbi:MAG: hypothetical protein A2X23_01385 [Chloroflexi bacterium GWC2_73_18]|nr:MAG: hypothetical protein A2X23_01385 [Chloroflexi bacterium GWC2_73_18]